MTHKRTERLLSLLLTVLMVVSMLPSAAFAAEGGIIEEAAAAEEVQKEVQEEAKIEIQEGPEILAVLGPGEEEEEPWADGSTPPNNQIFYTATGMVEPWGMTTYDSKNSSYDSNAKKGIMSFTEDITALPDNCFNRQEEGYNETSVFMTNIILPDSVTSIGNFCFLGCNHMQEVSMPKVTSIGYKAISSCTWLKSISLPSVTSIDSSAFSGCVRLVEVFMPKVTTIGSNIFLGCYSLQYVYAPVTKDIQEALNDSCYFKITIPPAANGTISIKNLPDFTEVEGCTTYFGKNVVVTVTPDDGYVLDTLKYSDGTTETAIEKDNNGDYSFLIQSNVIVMATFKKAPYIYVDDDWAGTEDGTEVGTEKIFGTNAFATIQDAVKAADVSNGTVIISVAAGTYAEEVNLKQDNLKFISDGNTWYGRLNILGEEGAVVTGSFTFGNGPDINVANLKIDGFTFTDTDYPIYIDNNDAKQGNGLSKNIKISNNTFNYQGFGPCVDSASIDNLSVTGNTFTSSKKNNAQIGAPSGSINNITISENSFSRYVSLYGLVGTDGVTVSDNTFTGNADEPIWMVNSKETSTGKINLSGNTIAGTYKYAIGFRTKGGYAQKSDIVIGTGNTFGGEEITAWADAADNNFVVSENAAAGEALYYGGKLYLGDETAFTTVQAAVNAIGAGTSDETTKSGKVTMLSDSQENVIISQYQNITLDLNGHVLKGDGVTPTSESQNHSVITNAGTLTLIDSNPTAVYYFTYVKDGAWTLDSAEPGEDANVIDLKDFTLEKVSDASSEQIYHIKVTGGVITGGTGEYTSDPELGNGSLGGGVFNEGTFLMKGGNISGNTAAFDGGGVYNGGTFTMTGGCITGNSANFAGGVFNGGSATIGGTAQITDNAATTAGNNMIVMAPFALGDGETVAIPANGMKVGVSLLDDNGNYTNGKFTTNGTTEDVQYFTSDNGAYIVKYNETGTCLELVDHIHSWTYSVSGSTITANCIGAGTCSAEDTSLTISAPAGDPITYDSQKKDANFGEATSFCGDSLLPTITYQYTATKDGAYTDTTDTAKAGYYKASFTVGSGEGARTASVEYEVEKAAPEITFNPTASGITYGQTLYNSTLSGGLASVDGTFTWKDSTIAPQVSDSNTTEYAVVFTPDDSANYKAVECKVKLTVNMADNGITGTIICADVMEDSSPCPGGVEVQFGKIYYLYSSNGENWGTWEEIYTGVGDYQVKAVVDETVNYNGCESDSVTFTVKPKLKISITGDDTARHTDVKSYTVSFEGDRPSGTTIVWDITGGNYEYVGDHIGTNSVSIICEDVGTLHIHAVLVDYEGKPVVNSSGEIVEATKDVNVKAQSGNILNMIASFFRKIFSWLFG